MMTGTQDSTSRQVPQRTLARECVQAGIDAAHPNAVVQEHLSLTGGTLTVCDRRYELDQYEEIIVLGGGNAAGTIAAELERLLGDWVTGGIVVTDTLAETKIVEVRVGDHPLPSERNCKATAEILARAAAATADTLVLAPITGGGSALLCAPIETVPLSTLQQVTQNLLNVGADVDELNAVRRMCSRVKGGRLADTAAPADVVGLLFSDVVGDNSMTIASGPTVSGRTSPHDVVSVFNRYDLDVPSSVERRLETQSKREQRIDDAVLDNHILTRNRTALNAAADRATKAGYRPLILTSTVRGEAQEVAKMHVAIAEECRQANMPAEPPVALLSGGETTVTVDGDGNGGPNQEFCLSAALELDTEGVVIAAVDTDGRDGVSDAAGAVVDHTTVPPHQHATAVQALVNNDAGDQLAAYGSLVETGDTGTNVNDLRVILVGESNR